LGRHCTEGAIEVVDGLDEVVCEAGDGERAGGVDVAFCAVLEVAEVRYAAEIFVLWERGVSCLGVE